MVKYIAEITWYIDGIDVVYGTPPQIALNAFDEKEAQIKIEEWSKTQPFKNFHKIYTLDEFYENLRIDKNEKTNLDK